MADAWIKGNVTPLDEAIVGGARLLAHSKQPLIAGLGVDVAGIRAAVALAEQVGGVLDHMHSQAILRGLDCARETGVMLTTPLEARVRADVVCLVGPDLDLNAPEMAGILRFPANPEGEARRRKITWICPGHGAKTGDLTIATIAGDRRRLPLLLAALRARIANRPVALQGALARQIDGLAAELRSARFGVAVWSAHTIDAMPLEMLNGIVLDLNEETRFSSLPLCLSDNADGVLSACGSAIGYPMRTGFGRGSAEHDAWRFSAVRLDENREIDCTVWLSAYRALPPDWPTRAPVIALTGAAARFIETPAIQIAVGCPGVDHDGTSFCAETGTLRHYRAAHPSNAISAAAALARLAESIRQIRG
jgi:formylmethanofuran dehydrogenase subunit B